MSGYRFVLRELQPQDEEDISAQKQMVVGNRKLSLEIKDDDMLSVHARARQLVADTSVLYPFLLTNLLARKKRRGQVVSLRVSYQPTVFARETFSAEPDVPVSSSWNHLCDCLLPIPLMLRPVWLPQSGWKTRKKTLSYQAGYYGNSRLYLVPLVVG